MTMEGTLVQSQPVHFTTGQTVIYGLIGHCLIVEMLEKRIGDRTIHFYKIEKKRVIPSGKGSPAGPAILVPLETAVQSGMRSLMRSDEYQEFQTFLANQEHYIDLSQPWPKIQSAVENLIKVERLFGMAKAFSALHVYNRRSVVPHVEAVKMYDRIGAIIAREISELTAEPSKIILARLEKLMRPKLRPDH